MRGMAPASQFKSALLSTQKGIYVELQRAMTILRLSALRLSFLQELECRPPNFFTLIGQQHTCAPFPLD